jgi:three-Cys-motif partner protein
LPKRSHVENTVGSWAHQKLDALERYLKAYTVALKNQSWCETIYIDAFAGAGLSKLRRAPANPKQATFALDADTAEANEEYVRGSPLRALGLPLPFRRYVFLEEDAARVEMLEGLKVAHPGLAIDVRICDANPVLVDIAGKLTSRQRAVVFLDPYAAQLNWSTVEALARLERAEVIINFPAHMVLNRLLPRSGEVTASNAATLDRVFGSSAWREAVYPSSPSLFGDVNLRSEDGPRALLDVYVAGLRGLYRFVAPPRLIRTPAGLPLYYLIWAGPKESGFRIAKHILEQGEHVEVADPDRQP